MTVTQARERAPELQAPAAPEKDQSSLSSTQLHTQMHACTNALMHAHTHASTPANFNIALTSSMTGYF